MLKKLKINKKIFYLNKGNLRKYFENMINLFRKLITHKVILHKVFSLIIIQFQQRHSSIYSNALKSFV